jgi:Tol biopolymer transport system component
MAFSPDGKTLASGGQDKTIKIWDIATGKEKITFKGHEEIVYAVAFAPDGKTLASGSEDGTIRLWDLSTNKEKFCLRGHKEVRSVAYSRDGKTLASGDVDGSIKLWNLATGKEKLTLVGHEVCADSLAFSPDGHLLASGSTDKTIKTWDLTTGKIRSTFASNGNMIDAVAFSPDSRTLASADCHFEASPGFVRLWNVATGKERACLNGHSSVAFTSDGRTIASLGGDHSIKLWNVATGKELTTTPLQTEKALFLALSPDGKTIASDGLRNSIQLWDVLATKELDSARTTALTVKELDDLWMTLADTDEKKAYQAIGILITEGDRAIALLRKRLQPTERIDLEIINRWIADLDSDKFEVRQTAREALEKAKALAETALRRKLAEDPSSEVQRLIEHLLTKLDQDQQAPETLRELRAIEVLEHIGSSDAKQVLQTLAKGAQGARLTNEARVSLERLNKLATKDK